MSYFIKGNDKKSSVPSECKATVTSVNTNTANCEPEFFERCNTKCKSLVGYFCLESCNWRPCTKLLHCSEGNSKKSEDDDFSWVSSQDSLVVSGEEKITVYFDNGASQSVDHNWINKLVEPGGWKQDLTLGTIVESHFKNDDNERSENAAEGGSVIS